MKMTKIFLLKIKINIYNISEKKNRHESFKKFEPKL